MRTLAYPTVFESLTFPPPKIRHRVTPITLIFHCFYSSLWNLKAKVAMTILSTILRTSLFIVLGLAYVHEWSVILSPWDRIILWTISHAPFLYIVKHDRRVHTWFQMTWANKDAFFHLCVFLSRCTLHMSMLSINHVTPYTVVCFQA